jgi:hypothetical protein
MCDAPTPGGSAVTEVLSVFEKSVLGRTRKISFILDDFLLFLFFEFASFKKAPAKQFRQLYASRPGRYCSRLALQRGNFKEALIWRIDYTVSEEGVATLLLGDEATLHVSITKERFSPDESSVPGCARMGTFACPRNERDTAGEQWALGTQPGSI